MSLSLVKPVLSALVKPLAAAGAALVATHIPGLDPSVVETTLSVVLSGVVVLVVEQVSKVRKAAEAK